MATALKGRKRSLDKPLCKYGISCYQKNPEHHRKFKHPSKHEDNERKVDLNFLNDAGTNIGDSTVTKETEILIIPQENKLKNSSNESFCEETVDQVLKLMPKDFFDFWDFCSSLKASNPEDAFSEFGYKLVGVYDLLVKRLPKDTKVDISCHWRYFYDPPEFQTVIIKKGKQMFHIGYFRDDPSQMPTVLASNCVSEGAKLTLMGDNIFAAMSIELKKIAEAKKPILQSLAKLQNQLKEYAIQKKYFLNQQTVITRARQKKVVSKTFHELGIVVPVKNDVGYRRLVNSNSTLKNILNRIVNADNEEQRMDIEESLDDIITNIQFANDEGDCGAGFEIGIDLFCYGHTYFHDHILSLLPLAYKLLKRSKYASIVYAHLKDRKKDAPLKSLDV